MDVTSRIVVMATTQGYCSLLRHTRGFSCFPALLGPEVGKLFGESIIETPKNPILELGGTKHYCQDVFSRSPVKIETLTLDFLLYT